MANSGIPNDITATWYEPRALQWTRAYMKRLLIERHDIRAAIENPGGSIIAGGVAQAADADQLPSYSSVLGNDFHLDLLEAEQEINRLEPHDRIELLAWCDGLTPKQAAQWANVTARKPRSTANQAIRKRLQRSVAVLTDEANGHEDR